MNQVKFGTIQYLFAGSLARIGNPGDHEEPVTKYYIKIELYTDEEYGFWTELEQIHYLDLSEEKPSGEILSIRDFLEIPVAKCNKTEDWLPNAASFYSVFSCKRVSQIRVEQTVGRTGAYYEVDLIDAEGVIYTKQSREWEAGEPDHTWKEWALSLPFEGKEPEVSRPIEPRNPNRKRA